MIRLVLYILASLALAFGLTWLFGTDGRVLVEVGDWVLQPSVGTASVTLVLVFLAFLLVWTVVRRIITAPTALAAAAKRSGERRAVTALGESLIALEAGDAQRARALAREAATRLPNSEAARLVEARASLKLGDWNEARDTYRTLLDDPRTAVAALSGLYDQALAQGRSDAALTFAQKAYQMAPTLTWASDAVFADLTKAGQWNEALAEVDKLPSRSKDEKEARDRKRTVLLTALAAEAEDKQPDEALERAQAALKVDADFVPAALIAGRLMSAKGEVRKASSLLRRVWRASAHPHVAVLYAHAQPGISPKQRLARVQELVPNPPQDAASAIVLAQVAIEAEEWVVARNAMAGYSATNPTRDMCLAMAEIEEGQSQDHGRAREWLAKAVSAPADATWTADGQTFDEWQAVSPISGTFDALTWRQPVAAALMRVSPAAPSEVVAEVEPADLAKPVN